MANLKAMFEKKPAESLIPPKKLPAEKKEEGKIEQTQPASVSNLKSVFEKKNTTVNAAPPLKGNCIIILTTYIAPPAKTAVE